MCHYILKFFERVVHGVGGCCSGSTAVTRCLAAGDRRGNVELMAVAREIMHIYEGYS